MKLTAKYLRTILRYEPRTGRFFWRVAIARKVVVGAECGKPWRGGYGHICIHGIQYRSHVLAWIYMTGRKPRKEIDHKDRDKANTRWTNLRLATSSQNKWNGTYRCGRSGVRGVGWHARDKLWRAVFCIGNKRRTLGYSKSKKKAVALRRAAEIKYYGEFRSCG